MQTRGGTSTGGGASPLLPADGREDCEKTGAAFLWGTHVEVIRQFDSELLGRLSWIVSPAQRSTTSGPCAKKKKPTGVWKLCVVGAYTPHNQSGLPSLMHNSPPWRITCWLSRGGIHDRIQPFPPMEPFVWTSTHIDSQHPTHAFGSPKVNFRRSAATYIVKSPMAKCNYPVSPSCIIPQGPEVAAVARLVAPLRPPPQQQTIASHCLWQRGDKSQIEYRKGRRTTTCSVN